MIWLSAVSFCTSRVAVIVVSAGKSAPIAAQEYVKSNFTFSAQDPLQDTGKTICI